MNFLEKLQQNNLSFWRSFFQKTIHSIMQPKRVYEEISSRRYFFPFFFALISITLVNLLYGLEEGFLKTDPEFFEFILSISHPLTSRFPSFARHEIFIYVVSNLLFGWGLLIFEYLFSYWFHLLFQLRNEGRGYSYTFQVFSFAKALEWGYLIPIFGAWIVLIWNLVWTIRGLKKVHASTYTKVITTFFFANITLGLIFFGIFFLIGYFWEA